MAARDPWQPVGTLLYHLMVFAARFGFKVHGGVPVERDYPVELEPVQRYCMSCRLNTMWRPYHWVLEGITDYECDGCGAIS